MFRAGSVTAPKVWNPLTPILLLNTGFQKSSENTFLFISLSMCLNSFIVVSMLKGGMNRETEIKTYYKYLELFATCSSEINVNKFTWNWQKRILQSSSEHHHVLKQGNPMISNKSYYSNYSYSARMSGGWSLEDVWVLGLNFLWRFLAFYTCRRRFFLQNLRYYLRCGDHMFLTSAPLDLLQSFYQGTGWKHSHLCSHTQPLRRITGVQCVSESSLSLRTR